MAKNQFMRGGGIEINGLIKSLEDTQKEDRLAILFTNYYDSILPYLNNQGYKENVDIFDGRILLPNSYKMYLSNKFEVIRDL